MERLSFSTIIDASAETVWRALLEDSSFREWTSAFCEGSYAVTDWKEGSKALFLSPDGCGMVSRIAVHRPNEFLDIEHLGVVKDGVENTGAGKDGGWAGARESYRLVPEGKGVRLTVESDTTPEYSSFFREAWPKALENLRRICEGRLGQAAKGQRKVT